MYASHLNEELFDDFDKWYDKIKAEYNWSEDAKAKAAETVTMRKLDREVEDSAKQNKVYEMSKASPLVKNVEDLKQRTLKRISDNRARKQLKFPHAAKRKRATPPGTSTRTASKSPRRGRSPPHLKQQRRQKEEGQRKKQDGEEESKVQRKIF